MCFSICLSLACVSALAVSQISRHRLNSLQFKKSCIRMRIEIILCYLSNELSSFDPIHPKWHFFVILFPFLLRSTNFFPLFLSLFYQPKRHLINFYFYDSLARFYAFMPINVESFTSDYGDTLEFFCAVNFLHDVTFWWI